MVNQLWNRFGAHAMHAAAGGHIRGSRFNMKLGFALLQDGRIGVWPKLLSLGIGAAATALLFALEISPEMILAAILPGLGVALDFVADGAEALVLPVLFGTLALPFVAPRGIVDQIMMERDGVWVEPPPPLPTN